MKPRAESRIGREERREPLRKVGIHQPLDSPFGDGLERRQRDGEEVERLRHRLAVEVASGDHLAVVEDQRIVGRGIQFDRDRLGGEPDGVSHRAEHLRRTAQAVGILDARIVFSRCDSRISLSANSARMRSAASIWPRWGRARVNPRIEGCRRAPESLEAHGGGARGGPPEHLRIVHQEREECRLGLGAVDKCEAFLRGEPVWLEPRGRERRAGRTHGASSEHAPFAHQSQRDVTEWRQVTAGPDASLLGHGRHDAGVEHAPGRVHQLWPHSAGRAQQHVGAEHHDRADHRRGQAGRRRRPRGFGSGWPGADRGWSGATRTLASFPNPVLIP